MMSVLFSELLPQIAISPLHSGLNQARRRAELEKFRSHRSKILICTDIAARGLDLPHVDLVIHYDLPRMSADYLHRCGRTARAGRSGRSIAFVSQYDIELLQALEAKFKIQLPKLPPPLPPKQAQAKISSTKQLAALNKEEQQSAPDSTEWDDACADHIRLVTNAKHLVSVKLEQYQEIDAAKRQIKRARTD